MAKAAWVGVSPSSGSGDADVSITSNAEHTGRTLRSSIITFTGADVTNVQVTVNQAGKPEFADIPSTAAAVKLGQILTISGTSNSKKLTFSLGSGELNFTLPANYTANTAEVANGAEIAGDPGAASQYAFSIALTIPANEGIVALTRQLKVTDEAGNVDICLITLAAGDAYLTVTPLTVELDWQGNAETVAVSSNIAWEVE